MLLPAASRNASADAVVLLTDAGAGAGTIKILDGASVVGSVTLKDPAFLAAVAGVSYLIGNDGATAVSAGNALVGAGSGSGTADGFEIQDSDGNVVLSGTVSEAGGGGEMIITDTEIVNLQEIRITGFSYTQPAG